MKIVAIAIAYPVHALADVAHAAAKLRGVHIPRKHLRWPIGMAFMVTGSGLAVISGGWGLSHGVHIVIDMFAYGVHGAGAVPFVNVVIRHLKLEDEK